MYSNFLLPILPVHKRTLLFRPPSPFMHTCCVYDPNYGAPLRRKIIKFSKNVHAVFKKCARVFKYVNAHSKNCVCAIKKLCMHNKKIVYANINVCASNCCADFVACVSQIDRCVCLLQKWCVCHVIRYAFDITR